MNEIVRRISLDLSRKSNISLIFSSQTDMNSRVFLISLFDDGRPYFITSETSVAVNVKRSDGTSAAFIADVTEDGIVKYTAGSWALGVAGLTNFSVSLYNGNAQKLTSSSFTVDIAPGLYLGLEVGEDDEEQNVYDSMLNKFAEAIAEAEKAQKSAEKGAEDAMYSVQYAEGFARDAEGFAHDAEIYTQNAQKFAYESETFAHDAWDFREEARKYAEDTKEHESDALSFAQRSELFRDEAEGYRDNAEDFSDAAEDYSILAKEYAEKTALSVQEASGSASEANEYAAEAEEWSEQAKASAALAVEAAASVIEAVTGQSPAIINSASGELISVRDSAERPAVAFKVVGKSAQDSETVKCVKQGTKIKICGKNLLDTDAIELVKFEAGYNEASLHPGVLIQGPGTYHLSAKNGAKDTWIYAAVLDLNNNFIRGASPQGSKYLVTQTSVYDDFSVELAENERLVMYDASINQTAEAAKSKMLACGVMIEVGSVKTEYEPYVSGGELVTPCDLYEGDIWHPVGGAVEKSDGSSEQYEAQSVATLYWKTSIVQFPIELAADIELQYVADTKIYIDNKLAELQAMILEG